MGEEKTKVKKKLKYIIPLFILIVLGIITTLFIKNMNGPAQGSVAYTASNQSTIKPATPSSKKYNGQQISFTYPEHYKIVPSQQSKGYLDIISLNNTDHSGKYISIGVIKENLTNDSGINYRRIHPELYKQIASSSEKVVFDSISGKSERTAFIAHNGLVSTVSFTANGNRDLTEDFDTIVNSLQWNN
jgi:hypothetical protein